MQNKPGNSFQRANDLGSLTANQNRSGRLQPKDRNDFYSFSLSKRSTVSLGLNALKANADLKLFRGDRTLVTASRQPGKRPEQISTTLDPGTYYLQVSGKGGKNGKTTYNLNAAAAPIPAPIPAPAPAPVTPSVPPPVTPKQGKFEVLITGFTVNQQTIDIENPSDGRHDEVFLRSQVHTQNLGNGVVNAQGIYTDMTMGQWFPGKQTFAGSGTPSFLDILTGNTTPGGLQTGDNISPNLPVPPGYVKDMRYRDRLMTVWDGTLVSGQTAVYITPTIWDSDRTPEQEKVYAWNTPNFSLQSASETGTFNSVTQQSFWDDLNQIFSGARPISSLGTEQNALFQSGRKLFGNKALGANSGLRDGDLFVTNMTRPIGMTRQGSDYSFDPLVLPLTYEMASFISNTTFTDKGKGTIALRYVDDSTLGGDYTVYLKVQPSSSLS